MEGLSLLTSLFSLFSVFGESPVGRKEEKKKEGE